MNKYLEKIAQNIKWTEKDHKALGDNFILKAQDEHPIASHVGGAVGAFKGLGWAENKTKGWRAPGNKYLRGAQTVGRGLAAGAGVIGGMTLGSVAGSQTASLAHTITSPEKKKSKN